MKRVNLHDFALINPNLHISFRYLTIISLRLFSIVLRVFSILPGLYPKPELTCVNIQVDKHDKTEHTAEG